MSDFKAGDKVRLDGGRVVWKVQWTDGDSAGLITENGTGSAQVRVERLEVVRPAFYLPVVQPHPLERVILRADGFVEVRTYGHDAEHNAQVCLAALLADWERREREEAAKP
jgi:hypothetical protein